MKPIKLQFKGINSFSEQTEIDFEKLTKNGIFGIFGDTGSGKSTILDCINFALYGKVERSREKIDIINYRSEAAEVKFEFDVLTEGKRKRYFVERSIRKKSGIHKALLYEDGACIADNTSTVTKKITDVLGVDAEDFRKCIALPQGEFSQFVKSQPSERIALIERLFSLSKYGDRLKERIKLREGAAEMSYQTISAKLGLYSDVSIETINAAEGDIEKYKKQIQRLLKDNETAEKNYTQLKALSEKRAELDNTIKELAERDAEKTRMEELRAGLKAVPVCKTVAETDGEINNYKSAFSKLEKELGDLDKYIETETAKISKLNLQAEKGNFDEEISKCITLSARYSACEGKPEKLLALEKLLENKRREYRLKEDELLKLKNNLLKAESEVKETEKKLADCSAKNLEQLINVNFKGAILKEEYVNTLDYFVGLNGQVKFHKDDSELYKFISRELKQQIEIYKDRVYQVKDFSLQEARNSLKTVQSFAEQRDKLNAILNEKTVRLKDAQAAVNDCAKEMQIIKRDGEEIRKQSDEIKCELEKVFGKIIGGYAEEVQKNNYNLENLKKEKLRISTEVENANKTLSELTTQRVAKLTEKNTVNAEINKLCEKLNVVLLQSDFESVASCKKLVDEYSKFGDAEKALEEYDLSVKALTAKRAELEKNKGLTEFSFDALQEAEEMKNSVMTELTDLRERLAVLDAECKKAKERLEQKKTLQKQLDEAEKERNLIAQLKEITKGNKFMEYIANEYLEDISSLASSTLLNLTDGRYFLTYTDTFYAGDNFNCGNLRGVNTLSGGETFLVSLSLALALSQTICSSLKSIEFFFLDEGFGTLDGALVDTVMSALEKLKSSRFTIGVISHVEELKHRIDNKITVFKATENHGSTVQLSC